MRLIFVLLLFMTSLTHAQENLKHQLISTYQTFREPSLNQRRFKHEDIQPLLANLDRSLFTVQPVGSSVEGRSISMVTVGTGPIHVLLWSQMHGDEPTATMALFDIFNFLKNSSVLGQEKTSMLSKLTLHFIPMLNPDGAQRFRRRNALDVDINRDAVRLQSPEAKLLKRVRDSLNADFGFNLHDQNHYHNVEHTPKQATISVLAPAFNYAKDVNDVRAKAMKLIVYMDQVLQSMEPGYVGRYDDAFEPRAFGDNIQKWGTSTVLIESGGYPGDPEKQHIRMLNYVAILSAFFGIADNSYAQADLDAYNKIPWNDDKLLDLLLRKVSVPVDGRYYTLDIGVIRDEIDIDQHTRYYESGSISDIGDLSTYYGYNELDASGWKYVPAKVYPDTLKDLDELRALDIRKLLKEGYAYFRMEQLPDRNNILKIPAVLVPAGFSEVPEFGMYMPATFLLQRDEEIGKAVVNGFLVDLSGEWPEKINALIR